MIKIGRRKKDDPPLCYDCSYDLNEDAGKYEVKVRRKKFRVVMKPVTDTIYSCPKCGCLHITPAFKPKMTPHRAAKMVRRKQEERVEQLRKMHQKKRLYSVLSSFLGEYELDR